MQVTLYYIDGEKLTFVRIDRVRWESKKDGIVRMYWIDDSEEEQSYTVPGIKKWETREDEKQDERHRN